ncbi:MAG: thiamine biosynthesis protein ThiJ [Clostridia bacterium BRH_c25]|nr:MAG: thiamine biosynthesis protein ThiJ [Clostridia bacterium BRH_c25]
MKKVYVYLAEGFEEIEAITVVDVLRRAEIDARMISITGRKEVKGAHGITISADEVFENTDSLGADMIVLPGGMPGTKYLGEHKGLREVILGFAEKNKLIAAICAAPSILGRLGLLDKKKAVCYPGFEETLKGAVLGEDIISQEGNFITSKGPGTAIYFALRLVELLADNETAEELREGMIVQG